jgi:putative glycosyltransferase
MKLAIVSTVYNGQNTVGNFLIRLDEAVGELDVEKPVHLSLVNDGSHDLSLDIIQAAKMQHVQVKLVDLAKNYGHHQAIFTGIHSLPIDCDYVVIIDSDLEENPAYISTLIETLKRSRADVILTFQTQRVTGLFNRAWAYIAEVILKLILGSSYNKGICTLRIMRSYVALEFKNVKDLNPVLGIIHRRLGFKTESIEIEKSFKGSTEYTFLRRVRLFSKMLFSASRFLSLLALGVGLCGLGISFVSAIFFLYYRFAFAQVVPGFTTLGILITVFGGILIFIGSISITLLIKILDNANGGSRVVVKEIHDL